MLQRSLLIFFYPLCLLAQNLDIRGVVSDSVTGERLPFANISILQTAWGAATNLNGFFLISNVPPANYEIAASAVGYNRLVKPVVVEGTVPVILNFRLSPQPVQMEGVTVSGMNHQALSEIRTSTHVLGRQELQRVPVSGQDDILRSIQILPGIVSTSDVNSQFYVRGGSGDQNLILLDGMRIYNPFHAFGLFSIFDPDVVKTVEVYTGAFPPEYGNRLSSVIKISTRDGNASAISGHGDINFLSSKIQLESPLTENIQWIATGRKSLFSNVFQRFLRDDVPLSFYDGLMKATYKSPDAENRYSLKMFVSRDDLNSASQTDPDYSWSNFSGAFEINTLFTDRLFLSTSLSMTKFNQQRSPKFESAITPASTAVTEFAIRTEATLYGSSNDLFFFGFEFDIPNLDYSFVDRFGHPRKLASTEPELSVWAHYQAALGDLQADVGARMEFSNLLAGFPFRSAFQPRLNFSYDLGSQWKAKASYGHVSQTAITVNNEDDLIPIFYAWIAVPKNVQAEEADHYVLGIEGNPLFSVSTSLQGYYKSYNPIVAYNRNRLNATEADVVLGHGESYGAELLVRTTDPVFDFYSAYTLSWTTLTLDNISYPPRYDRRHTLNILATLHILDNLDLTSRVEFGSGLPFTQSVGYYDRLTFSGLDREPSLNETGQSYALLGPKNAVRLPPYHRLDVNLSYRLSISRFFRASFGVNLVNAYNRKNIFYFDRSTGRRVDMLGFFPSASMKLELLP